MADLFLLSEAQMRRIEGYFPLSHCIARVDDRRIVSAMFRPGNWWIGLSLNRSGLIVHVLQMNS